MLAALEFREPLLLWLLLLCVPVFFLSRRAPGRIVYSALSLLPRGRRSLRERLHWLPDALLALACAALVVALAGPRSGERFSRIEREGIAIMLAVDTSGSMQALDLSTDDTERTRLAAVQDVLDAFVRGDGDLPGRPDDAIGLVSFAGYADTAVPLTLDHANLAAIARDLEIVTERSEDGTAIGDALGLAVERLRESPAESKVVVLLTDGVHNAGLETPAAAAELARSMNVTVYTIGAGTNGLAPVRVRDPFSGRSTLRAVRVEVDEETLADVAQRTGGRFFRATDAAGLVDVYAEIDRLTRTRITEERFRQYTEHYRLPLLLGLLLALAGWLARLTVLARGP
ncbi:MAG: VWA domain-containing protein [Pseudomonadota bacterium]